eukprot:g58795.t1
MTLLMTFTLRKEERPVKKTVETKMLRDPARLTLSDSTIWVGFRNPLICGCKKRKKMYETGRGCVKKLIKRIPKPSTQNTRTQPRRFRVFVWVFQDLFSSPQTNTVPVCARAKPVECTRVGRRIEFIKFRKPLYFTCLSKLFSNLFSLRIED